MYEDFQEPLMSRHYNEGGATAGSTGAAGGAASVAPSPHFGTKVLRQPFANPWQAGNNRRNGNGGGENGNSATATANPFGVPGAALWEERTGRGS